MMGGRVAAREVGMSSRNGAISLTLLALAGIGGLGAGPIGAASVPNSGLTQPEAKMTPEARRVVDRLREHYAGVKGLSVKYAMSTSMKMGEDEHKNASTMHVRVSRPNLLSVSDRAPEEKSLP